jgi:hypothetical protein
LRNHACSGRGAEVDALRESTSTGHIAAGLRPAPADFERLVEKYVLIGCRACKPLQ